MQNCARTRAWHQDVGTKSCLGCYMPPVPLEQLQQMRHGFHYFFDLKPQNTMERSSEKNAGDNTIVILPWWKKENKKTTAKRCYDEGASSDIIVRKHTRKRSKVTAKTAKNDVGVQQIKKPKVRSMDVATYRLITQIQKEELKETVASNKARADPSTTAVRQQWETFMKSSVKASKKAKGKKKSAIRREKKAVKEQQEMEIQEFIALHMRLHAVDFDVPMLTAGEYRRYTDLLKLQHCFDRMSHY